MNEANQTAGDGGGLQSGALQKWLRLAVYAAIAVQCLIFLSLLVYIGWHVNPRGDGMELVALMPAGMVLLVGVMPAWVMREREKLLPFAVIAAVIGIVLNAALFAEIMREMPGGGC